MRYPHHAPKLDDLESFASRLACGDSFTLGTALAAADPTPDELRCVAYYFDAHTTSNGHDDGSIETAAAVSWATVKRGRDRLAGQPARPSILDPGYIYAGWHDDDVHAVRQWWADTYADADPADTLAMLR